MNLGRIGRTAAIIAVFCVLTVFFFHAMQGPYSVVHGPVTALLSARAATGLRVAMVHAGLYTLPRGLFSLWVLPGGRFDGPLEIQWNTLSPSSNFILRC